MELFMKQYTNILKYNKKKIKKIPHRHYILNAILLYQFMWPSKPLDFHNYGFHKILRVTSLISMDFIKYRELTPLLHINGFYEILRVMSLTSYQ